MVVGSLGQVGLETNAQHCAECGEVCADGKPGSGTFSGQSFCKRCWDSWEKACAGPMPQRGADERNKVAEPHSMGATNKFSRTAQPADAGLELGEARSVQGVLGRFQPLHDQQHAPRVIAQPQGARGDGSGKPWAPQAERRQGGLCRRVLVLRHGSRPESGADPPLDKTGRREAGQVASYLAQQEANLPGDISPIVAIFCSPFWRALETAVPVAQMLNLPICMEWGFCELLAHGWLHTSDPLPALRARAPKSLPGHAQLDLSYKTAVVPVYPDVRGRMQQGNAKQRSRPLQRHGTAVEAALSAAGGGSVLIVGHGSTHDFVAGALCPAQHQVKHHSGGWLVDHCSITTIVDVNNEWHLKAFGNTPWKNGGVDPKQVLPQRVVPKASEGMLAFEAQQQKASVSEETVPTARASGKVPILLAALVEADVPNIVQRRHRPAAIGALNLLLDSTAALQACDENGHTLLHLVVMAPPCGRAFAAVAALICFRVEVDARNKLGETPLLLAVRAASDQHQKKCVLFDAGCRLQLVRKLLEEHANVNVADPPTGETALMEVADLGDSEACRLLLDFRADPLCKSLAGMTAMHSAVEAGQERIAQLLRDAERASMTQTTLPRREH